MEAADLYLAISPSDTVDLAPFIANKRTTMAVYVGTLGTVRAVRADGTTVDFVGTVAGSAILIAVRRINSTGTTASNLVAMYKESRDTVVG